VDELREKVKYMLQKEVSLAKAISDAQGMADTFEHTKNEIGGNKYMAAFTALYFARKVKLANSLKEQSGNFFRDFLGRLCGGISQEKTKFFLGSLSRGVFWKNLLILKNFLLTILHYSVNIDNNEKFELLLLTHSTGN
jgi:hypothetical protein